MTVAVIEQRTLMPLIRHHRVLMPLVLPPEKLSSGSQRLRHLSFFFLELSSQRAVYGCAAPQLWFGGFVESTAASRRCCEQQCRYAAARRLLPLPARSLPSPSFSFFLSGGDWRFGGGGAECCGSGSVLAVLGGESGGCSELWSR
ncbi:unnamed protein product [Fraxinus pennsylvanica]|uniref:Uncharacterized protein n=1 Tax=Fraxinus pennsylvanica TaxID=56036 RepID=A0AAD2DNP0_9LAMI|nr:unnamed protein product [Fraxinus pennsylvanica]